MKQPAVYIVASKRNGTIYTGVTSNLVKRIFHHKEAAIEGFSKKYECKLLVYYEVHETMESAITREKQIKKIRRKMKIDLIIGMNPLWDDLYSSIV